MKVRNHRFLKYRRATIWNRDLHSSDCRQTGNPGDTGIMATTCMGLEVLFTRQQIAERVAEMGAQITSDLNGESW